MAHVAIRAHQVEALRARAEAAVHRAVRIGQDVARGRLGAGHHHPDLEVGYNKCRVRYTTHSVGGLSENDFICAAHIDAHVDARVDAHAHADALPMTDAPAS